MIRFYGIYCYLSILFLLLSTKLLFAGNIAADTIAIKHKANRYSLRTLAVNYTLFRDFATSPLFYRGGGLSFGHGWLNINNNRERHTELDFLGNITLAKTPKSNYFQTATSSFFFAVNGYFHYLQTVKKISKSKNTIRFGGAFLSTQNIRINPGLMNASAGLETFLNLMFSAKIERDISRNTVKDFRLLFIKKQLQPVKRKISFQLNAGIINLNRRPGYAYVYDSELNGTKTNGIKWIFDSYQWSLNGWRFQTRIEFSKYRPSGNGRKIAYLWDIAHAPGKFEPFQMAIHRIQYTLIINNNRK